MMLALAFLAMAPSALHVQGLNLVDEKGKTFKMRGVNICGLEWTAQGDHTLQSVDVAFRDWKVNIIRVPLSQDRWFGKAPDQIGDPTSYRKLVDAVADKTAKYGQYVLFDLHWSNAGETGQNIGQHAMPDQGSLEFWKDFAARYKNRPEVLFDLYNEPIETTWEIWRNGGPVEEMYQGKKLSYQAVGMQQLLDAIRATGAKNVVVAGGLGWAARMDQIPKYALKDPSGNGVIYANHFYPGWESVASWEKRIAAAQKEIPLLVGEFGASPAYQPMNDSKYQVANVLAVLRKLDLNWIAWCMHPSAQPVLIQDWTYKPTPFFGALVLEALKGNAVPIPPRRTKMSDVPVYTDSLQIGYQKWNGRSVDFASAEQAHGGAKSIKVSLGGNEVFQLGNVPFDALPFQALSFWIRPTERIESLKVAASIFDAGQPSVEIGPLEPGSWKHIELPFSKLGIEGAEGVKSFVFVNPNNQTMPSFYLDDIVWIGKR